MTDFPVEDIKSWLEENKIPSFAAAFGDKWSCIVADPLEAQDQEFIDLFGEALTKNSSRIAICFLNHDDDFLSVDVYKDGARAASYNSFPGYFDPDPSTDGESPKVTSPESFAEIGKGIDVEQVLQVLQSDEDYVYASEIHSKLATLLGLPEETVGAGFRYVLKGEVAGDWKAISIN